MLPRASWTFRLSTLPICHHPARRTCMGSSSGFSMPTTSRSRSCSKAGAMRAANESRSPESKLLRRCNVHRSHRRHSSISVRPKSRRKEEVGAIGRIEIESKFFDTCARGGTSRLSVIGVPSLPLVHCGPMTLRSSLSISRQSQKYPSFESVSPDAI